MRIMKTWNAWIPSTTPKKTKNKWMLRLYRAQAMSMVLLPIVLQLWLLPAVTVFAQQPAKLSLGRQAYLKKYKKAMIDPTQAGSYPPSFGEAFAGIERYEYISDIQTELDYENQKVTIIVSVFVSNPDNDDKDYGSGEYVNVWIDWNLNGLFDENEQVLDQINYAKGIGFTGTLEYKESVDIPDNAPPETWMRVVLGYGYDPKPIDSWYYGSARTQPFTQGKYIMGEISSFYLDDASSNAHLNSTSKQAPPVESEYAINETFIPNLDPYHGFWTGKKFVYSRKRVEGKNPFQNNELWDPSRWDNVEISFRYTPIQGLGLWEVVQIGIFKEADWWNYKPLYKKNVKIKLPDPSKPKKRKSFIPGKEFASLDKGDYYLVVAFKRPLMDKYPKQPSEDSYQIKKFTILRWPYYVCFAEEIEPDKRWNEAYSVDQIQHEVITNYISSFTSGLVGGIVALSIPSTFGISVVAGALTSFVLNFTVQKVTQSDAFWALSDYGKIRGDISWNYKYSITKYEWKGSSYEKTHEIDWYRKDYFRLLNFIKIGYYRDGGGGWWSQPLTKYIDRDSGKELMNPEDWPPTEFELGQYPNPDDYTGYGIIAPKIKIREGVDQIKPRNWPPEIQPRKMKVELKGNTYAFEVSARDPDGYHLKYEWGKSGGEWQGGTPNSRQASWKYPDEPGNYSISVRVVDERGRYDEVMHYISIPQGLTKVDNQQEHYALFSDVFSEFNDFAVDVDGDGFFDSLNVSMKINLSNGPSSEFSSYEIGAALAIPHLDTIKVVAMSNTISDSADIKNITLNFPGEAIRRCGHNGSFLLQDLYLTGLTDLGRSNIAYVQDAFETQPYQSQRFTPINVELLGVLFDEGVDVDNDGLFDVLSIGLDINVLEMSEIKVSGLLTDSNGDIIGEETVTVDSIQIGKNSVELHFWGESFNSENIDGPYILKHAIVYDTNHPLHFDTLETPYFTTPYPSEAFETIPVEFNSVISENGIDTDNDGLFNTLQIKMDITIIQNGKYHFYATLVDGNDNDVSYASASYQLGRGDQKVTLPFGGSEIFNSNRDGPYIFDELVIRKMDDPMGFSLREDPDFSTRSYTFSDFQSPPIGIISILDESTEDVDSDGKFDELSINFEMNVVTPNEYQISASLKGSQNNSITYSDVKSIFQAGTSTEQFVFDGRDIGDFGQDGPYLLDIMIFNQTGNIIYTGENLYSTFAYDYADFEQSSALFSGDFSDSTIDADGNRLYDLLKISTTIRVTVPGRYHLSGQLSDMEGVQIAESAITTELVSGLNEVHLEFSGIEIFNHGKDGPYILSELLLYDNSQNTWPLMDSFIDAHTTRAYQREQFEKNIAALNESFSDYGSDTDENGLIDYLTIEVGIDVLNSEQIFGLDASLYDVNDVFIQKVRVEKSMDAQGGVIQLNFDGHRIRGHGDAGPYHLRYLTLYDERYKVIDSIEEAYTTGDYDFTRFETSLPDLKLLNSDITVAGGWLQENMVLLKTTVYNFGGSSANAVPVRFRDAQAQIGPDVVLQTVSGAKPQIADVDWNIAGLTGDRTISVEVDPGSTIPEIDEENNRVDFTVALPITDFPGVPGNVSAWHTGSSVNLVWDAFNGLISGYNVYRSTVSGGPYERVNRDPVESPAFRDVNPEAGQTSYYTVTAVREGFPNMEGGYAQEVSPTLAVEATIQDYSVKPGTEFVLPVVLGDLMDKNIFSAEMKIAYDPLVLEARDASTVGTTAQAWSAPVFSIQPGGQIWIAMAGSSALPENGILVNVTFDVVGDPGDVCQIQFFEFILNEGDPPVFTQDGSFQVDFPTTVEAEKSRIPGTFALHQNYPNPFNPSTTIRYTIPPSASFHHVKLEIYNTLGEKMNTLVNEQQGPGTYSVQWHARNESGMQVPSGVYFYRLNAGSFIEVRKMLFLQ